ncbi:ethylene-responsive transcription factor ABI4-like [Panicum virgatum]|uniref:ethylene-responsive transcription factor ABI4-like n=1 Tax=Panicum virgatum TaxID=38727 RepID=UPI0019D5C000|nr:ethylene-responsive transcription factor ABI4-like [Panicum virgatum]
MPRAESGNAGGGAQRGVVAVDGARQPELRGGPDLGWVGVRERLWGGYAAEIRIPSSRSRVWIGRFDHALQAALAYDAAMFLFYGQKLPKLRRYNFPATPRPNVPEVVRKGLTVANVKAIAEKHARSFGRFFPLPPPPVIPAAAPAAAPPQMAEAAAAAAAAAAGAGLAAPLQVPPAAGEGGVAVDATPVVGAGATAVAGDRHGDDEVYIDAEILTAADCQFPSYPDDDFIGLLDVDMDLIFNEI